MGLETPTAEAPFQYINGKRAWGLKRTYGSMFFLEFGDPTPLPDAKKVHGEWHILVENCFWQFERGGDVVVCANAKPSEIDRIFSILNPEQVTGSSVENRQGHSSIFFEDDLSLKLFPLTSPAEDEDQWTLYGPGKIYYAMAADGLLRKSAERSLPH